MSINRKLSKLANIIDDATQNQYLVADGSGELVFGDLTVSLIDSTNTTITKATDPVTTLRFDTDSGFDLDDLGGGAVKIKMNSTFKTWQVPGQSDLVASGLDTIKIIPGTGLNITTDPNASPQEITFSTALIDAEVTANAGDFYIDGAQQPVVSLEPGRTYRFNQSDASNSTHALRFSITADGTHGGGVEYTTGVTVNGTPGTAGAYIEIDVTHATPQLYYYCANHSGMGASVAIGNNPTANVDIGASTPTAPSEGDLWLDESNMKLYIWYVDTDGGQWVHINPFSDYSSSNFDTDLAASSIGDLSDVDITTNAPTDGQALIWDNAASEFVPGDSFSQSDFDTAFTAKDTDDLSEGTTNLYYTDARVDAHINQSTASSGEVLSWNGTDYDWISNVGYSDSDVDAFLAGGTAGNIVTTGYLAGPATFTIDPAGVGDNTGTVVIAGNLQVDGTTTTINSTILEVEDKNMLLAAGAANAAAADGAGITVYGANATFTYDATNDRWTANKSIAADIIGTITGTVTDISNHTLDSLGDVNLAVAPTNGQSIIWDNATSKWIAGDSFNQTDFDNAIALKSIDVLSDVDTTTSAPTTGEALVWDGTNFIPGNVTANVSISASAPSNPDLGDVWLDEATLDMYVYYPDTSGNIWVQVNNLDTPTELNDLTDVDLVSTAPTNGQALIWDNANSVFVPGDSFSQADFDTAFGNKSIDDLSDVDTTTSAPSTGEALVWDGSNFVPGVTFSQSDFDTAFAAKDTDDLAEGSTNLYYTDARVDERLAVINTATVTVANVGGSNKYHIDGQTQVTISLEPGRTYRFDQSDATNNNHPLRFSTTSNGTHGGGVQWQTGVTIVGTPGTAGAYTQIAVNQGTPTLHYYCANHSGMGAKTAVGNIIEISELDDVNLVSTPPTDGQALIWDASSSEFIPGDSFSQSDFDTAFGNKSIDALSDVDTTTAAPTSGDSLVWDGSNFVPGTAGANVVVSNSAPTSPEEGDLWYDENYGDLFVYVTDGAGTSQWVAVVDQQLPASLEISSNPPANPNEGDLWIDEDDMQLYTYYIDVDSEQWVQITPAYAVAISTVSSSQPTSGYEGELWYDTANQTLYVYDGTTWQPTSSGGSIGSLTDVDTTTNPPTSNQALVWDNANSVWVPGTIQGFTSTDFDTNFAAKSTDDLSEGSTNLYYTDARVDTYVSGGSLSNIVTTGYLRGPATFTIDPAAHGDDTGTVVIAGNLQVDGVTTQINSTTLTVDDLNVVMGSGSTNATSSNGGGLTLDLGTDGLATFQYSSADDRWNLNKDLNVGTVYGNVSGQVTDISNFSTDDLSEGSTNLYFTDARALAATDGEIVKFANLFATLGDLPSASTYHGMFAHVHAEGKAYYAHGGNWVELIDVNSSIQDLSNVVSSSSDTLATGDFLLYDGTEFGLVNFATEVQTYADQQIALASIQDLTDVDGVDTPASGDILLYDSGSSHFGFINLGDEINTYFDTRFATKSVGGLTDVDTTGVSTGDALIWNGTSFAPGGSVANITISATAPSSPDLGDMWLDEATLDMYVYYPDTNGNIWVQVNNLDTPTELNDLTDVDLVTTAPTNGQALIWDNANSVFVPGDSFSQSDFDTAFGNKSIDDLSDVDTTSVSNGDVLIYNSSTTNFEPGTVSTYTSSDFDTDFAGKSTDDLSEGSTNLYYTDARVNTFLAGGTAGNIVTTGYLAGPANFTIDPAGVGDNTGKVIIAGDLQVDGTTTTINSTTVEVDDKNLVLGTGAVNAVSSNGGGIALDLGSNGDATITYNSTTDTWNFNKPIAGTGLLGNISIDSLSDVDTTTAAPASGNALVWDGTNFVPDAVAANISISASAPSSPSLGDMWLDEATLDMYVYYPDTNGNIWVQVNNLDTPTELNDLTDVDLVSTAPTDGQALIWDNANSVFVPGDSFSQSDFDTAFGNKSIDALSDVDTTSVAPTDGQTLIWDNANSVWEPGTIQGYTDADVTSHLAAFDGSIIPDTDVTYDLGSSTYAWKDVYIGPGSLYMNNTQVLSEDAVTSGVKLAGTTDQHVHLVTHGTGETTLETSADMVLTAHSSADITLNTTNGHIVLNGNVVAQGKLITEYPVVTVAGGKFVIDGASQAVISLEPGRTYRFDQADSSNTTHPLRFSTSPDGTHNSGANYTTGVTEVGTPGTAGAYTEIEVDQATPTLYYYCGNHSGMGASVAVGNIPTDIATVAPTDGQALIWDNSSGVFVPGDSFSQSDFDTALGAASIGELSDVDITTNAPADNSVLVWDSALGLYAPGFSSSVNLSGSVPSNPSEGDLWLNNNTMNLYVWYTDSDSSQWVHINPYSEAVRANIGATAPTNADNGDLWVDESNLDFYIYNGNAWAQLNQSNIPSELADLIDVASTTPTSGQALIWNNSTNTWEPGESFSQGDFDTAYANKIAANTTFGADVTVTGDLTVNGTTTTINSTTLEVDDINITVASGAANATAANGAGLTADLGTDGTATITYNSTSDTWEFSKPITGTGLLGNISIDDLSDVDTTTAAPATGDTLVWDGSNFAPGNAIANATIAATASAPTSPDVGDMWFDSTLLTLNIWDGSAWQLAGGGFAEVGNTAPSNPLEGQFWFDTTDPLEYVLKIYYNSTWEVAGGGGAGVDVTATPPAGPKDGDLWIEDTTMNLYVYYEDGDSNQWIQLNNNPSLASQGIRANVEVSATAPFANLEAGDLWYNSDDGSMYVYYEDVDTSQWVQVVNPFGNPGIFELDGVVDGTNLQVLTTDGAGNVSFQDVPRDISELTDTTSLLDINLHLRTTGADLIKATVDQSHVLELNRTTDTGEIIQIKAGGTKEAAISLDASNNIIIESTNSNVRLLGNEIEADSSIRFTASAGNTFLHVEGTVDDAFETSFVVTEPTAGRTVTFKDESGTVALTSDIPTDLTDLGIADGTINQVLKTDGAGTFSFQNAAAKPIATAGDNAPSVGDEVAGDLWYNTTDGSLYVYFEDVDTVQWVQVVNPFAQLSLFDLEDITDGTNLQVLTTDGAGNATFQDVPRDASDLTDSTGLFDINLHLRTTGADLIKATNSGSHVLELDRTTDTGEIIQLKSSGVQQGSINIDASNNIVIEADNQDIILAGAEVQTNSAIKFNASTVGTTTFTVTVASGTNQYGTGNKYYFGGYTDVSPTLILLEGQTYRFDQSDSSNATHQLLFSLSANGAWGGGVEYTTGVTKVGTAGSAGAYTEIAVPVGTSTLYYYCINHSGMGGQADTILGNAILHVEGPVVDAYETSFIVTNPEQDRTVTFKDESGTVALVSDIPTDLTDLGIADGTINQVLKTDGNGTFSFQNAAAKPIARAGDNAPNIGDEVAGDLWYNTTDGSLYVYYEDVDTFQWAQVVNPFAQLDLFDLEGITDGTNLQVLTTDGNGTATFQDVPRDVSELTDSTSLLDISLFLSTTGAGLIKASVDSNLVLDLNRDNAHGAFINISKDSTLVGSIGTDTAGMTFTSDNYRFEGTTPGVPNLDINSTQITANAPLFVNSGSTTFLTVEGATDDNNETIFAVTEPTDDRTITFKDESGTVALVSDIPTDLTDLGIADGSINQVLKTDGNGTFSFQNAASKPIATAGDNAPAVGDEVAGDLWYNTTDGSLYVYYEDVDTLQWTQVVNPFAQLDLFDLEGITDGTNLQVLTTDGNGTATFQDVPRDVSELTDTTGLIDISLFLSTTGAGLVKASSNDAHTLELNRSDTKGSIVQLKSYNIPRAEIGIDDDNNLHIQSLAHGIKLTGSEVQTDGAIRINAGGGNTFLHVEGTVDDSNETSFVVTEPTADRVITYKDESGTVALINDIPTSLLDIGITDGTLNQLLSTDGAGNFSFVNNAGISVQFSDTAPSLTGRQPGDLWYHTSDGSIYIMYQDIDTEQWVQIINPSEGGWVELTSSATLPSNGGNFFVDTSGGALTITLPANPQMGTTMHIIDGSGNAATNNVTIARNGEKIEAIDDDLLMDYDRATLHLVYYNATNGWVITEN